MTAASRGLDRGGSLYYPISAPQHNHGMPMGGHGRFEPYKGDMPKARLNRVPVSFVLIGQML